MLSLTLEEATIRCLSEIHQGNRRIVQISGPPAAGRRQLLHTLQQELGERPTAYLEVPSEDFDSGALALVQMGRASRNGAHRNCEQVEVPFAEKMRLVLESMPPETVVLLYAPWLQRDRSAATVTRSHLRLQHLVEYVMHRHPVVAVTNGLPGDLKINLQKWRADQSWGLAEFSGTPVQAGAELLLQGNRANSRLEIRLAVALLALSEDLPFLESALDRYECLPQLLEMLWERSTPWLRRAWQFLALSRKPVLAYCEGSGEFPGFSFLYSVLGTPTEMEAAVMQRCLGFERDGLFVLHERTIAFAYRQMDPTESLQKSMAQAHARWMETFLQQQKPWLALESEMHRDYHTLQAGELPERLMFQDQWAMAGRCLSLHFKLFDRAAECYAKAIELDPADAYSYHYLAYNRSRITPPLKTYTVEEPYQRAIDLEPTNVYWYPRYIAWLVYHGQFVKARRLWDQAIAETDSVRHFAYYYDSLHREVFRAALFVDYELCRRIVDDIEPRVRELDRFRRMRLLTDLSRLALESRDVVPTSVVKVAKRMKLLGPHLLPEFYRGQPRKSWYSAKVDEKERETLYLICGHYDQNREVFFTTEMTRGQLNCSEREVEFDELEVGRFLEFGDYGTYQLVRVHSPAGIDLRDILEFSGPG